MKRTKGITLKEIKICLTINMTDTLPKILIIGSSGQVGSALVKVLRDKYSLIYTSKFFFECISYTQLNEKLETFRPTTIINTLAYTNVDKAENDEEKALKLNTIFPKCWRIGVF